MPHHVDIISMVCHIKWWWHCHIILYSHISIPVNACVGIVLPCHHLASTLVLPR